MPLSIAECHWFESRYVTTDMGLVDGFLLVLLFNFPLTTALFYTTENSYDKRNPKSKSQSP